MSISNPSARDQPPDPLDPDGLLGAEELAALRAPELPRPLPTRAALDLHGDTPVRVVSWRGRRRWRGLALAGLGMFRPATAPVHAGVQDGPGYCREWPRADPGALGPAILLWLWSPGTTLFADIRRTPRGVELTLSGITPAHTLPQLQDFTARAHGLLGVAERRGQKSLEEKHDTYRQTTALSALDRMNTGYSLRRAASELNVNEVTLGRWIKRLT